MNEQELRSILSANIKRYRNSRNWSQVKLAQKLNLSTNFLADVEIGKSWISPLTLVKIADTLDVAPYELFKPEEAPSDTTKMAVEKMLKDVSVTFNDILQKIGEKYRA